MTKYLSLRGAAIVAAASFAIAAPASAQSLIGDTVSTNLTVGTTNFGTVTAVVGAGDEGNFFNNQFFDFGANTFAIRSTSAFSGGIDSSTNIVALTLSSLDFGTPITGVTFTSSLAGVTRTFNANSVTFNWVNQALPASTYLSATFLTGNGAVPEPATWAMMLLGFGAMGFAMRNRKTSTTARIRFA